jgi:hypothetical protein
MGTDVTMLFRHKLKTTNAKTVAVQLHALTNLPVHYFYEQHYTITPNNELKWIDKETFIKLGNIDCEATTFCINNEFFNKIIINDYRYEDELLIQKFGTDKSKWPISENDIYEEAMQFKGHPWYEVDFKHVDNDNKDICISIYKDSASIYAGFDARWFSFNKIFFKLEGFNDYYESVLNYRKNALEIIRFFGTAEAMYSPDQTEGCVLDNDAVFRTWQQSKDIAFALPAHQFCHISNHNLTGVDFSNEDDKSVFVFYDDFRDLE